MIFKRIALSLLDTAASLMVYPAGALLRTLRTIGVERLPRSRRALQRVRVFPIRDHYYEPQFIFAERSDPAERSLPGVAWNLDGQLALLSALSYAHEISDWPRQQEDALSFYLENDTFEAGDAEFWYQMIRHCQPRRIFEIGSGNSTLVARAAIDRNRSVNSDYSCRHVCIEPYEAPWLEQTGVEVVRQKVESVGRHFFSELAANDILFIDSSHVIRPDGDVLFEYLELLPTLQDGVIVHVHDIFSPRHYPRAWQAELVRFWNEQYLLEAFLTHNTSWRVLAALNYLQHNHFDRLHAVAPFLTRDREPGSFYLQKVVTPRS